MNFKTFTSSLVLTLLMAQSSAFAMHQEQNESSAIAKPLPKKRALPALPGKKLIPAAKAASSPKVPPSPEPAKAAVTPEALLQRTIMAGLEGEGGAYEAAVKKARTLVEDIRGTKTESFILPYLNLAEYLFALGHINSEKRTQSFQEASELYDKHLNYSEVYELLQLGEKQKILDGQSQLMPMARELKTNFKISGMVCSFLGHYEEAIDRFETALAIIDDNFDYDPEETLWGTALAAWAEAKEGFEYEEYPIKAAAYFEAYFKLNPKRVDLDDYIKAAKSAWEASKAPLNRAWDILKNMNSRLDIKYALGEEDAWKFMEQSGPFVSEEQKIDNEIDHLDNFFNQMGKEQPEDEVDVFFYDEANKANHIYQAHMRNLARNWLAKVVDTKDVTKQQVSPELAAIYEGLRTEIASSTIDDSSVNLNPNGYVSYVKPDPQRYINEATLAIKNGSYNYASFLADQMVEKFSEQGDMEFFAEMIRTRILKAKKGK